jgi:hypothetical protein
VDTEHQIDGEPSLQWKIVIPRDINKSLIDSVAEKTHLFDRKSSWKTELFMRSQSSFEKLRSHLFSSRSNTLCLYPFSVSHTDTIHVRQKKKFSVAFDASEESQIIF